MDKNNSWISVKRRLPRRQGNYLIFAPSAKKNKALTTMTWYIPGYGWCFLPKVWKEAVTHWQPLPKSPKRSRR